MYPTNVLRQPVPYRAGRCPGAFSANRGRQVGRGRPRSGCAAGSARCRGRQCRRPDRRRLALGGTEAAAYLFEMDRRVGPAQVARSICAVDVERVVDRRLLHVGEDDDRPGVGMLGAVAIRQSLRTTLATDQNDAKRREMRNLQIWSNAVQTNRRDFFKIAGAVVRGHASWEGRRSC